MKKKVVLLGSTGFVGQRLLKELNQRGDVSVEGYGSSRLDLVSPESSEFLEQILDEHTILISAVRPRPSEEPLLTFSQDIAIATNLARCISRKRIGKLLHFSTVSVYSDEATNMSFDEDTPVSPTSFYGISRMAAEYLLQQSTEIIGTPLVIFRPCKIYGPGDKSGMYGPARFIESIFREKKVDLYGDGSEMRDLLFVDDLVQITMEFAFGVLCGTYNVASGKSHSFQNILGILRKISGVDFDVLRSERSKPKVDQQFDTSKLMKAIPEFRFTELEEGIRRTVEDFKDCGLPEGKK